MLSRREKNRLQPHIHDIDVGRITNAFDALGEPNRCLIFRALLKDKYINVSGLASIIGISESLASQHLKTLLNAELVERTRKGKNVYYCVNRRDKLVKALQKVVEQ